MSFIDMVWEVCELYPFKSIGLAFLLMFVGAMLIQL